MGGAAVQGYGSNEDIKGRRSVGEDLGKCKVRQRTTANGTVTSEAGSASATVSLLDKFGEGTGNGGCELLDGRVCVCLCVPCASDVNVYLASLPFLSYQERCRAKSRTHMGCLVGCACSLARCHSCFIIPRLSPCAPVAWTGDVSLAIYSILTREEEKTMGVKSSKSRSVLCFFPHRSGPGQAKPTTSLVGTSAHPLAWIGGKRNEPIRRHSLFTVPLFM